MGCLAFWQEHHPIGVLHQKRTDRTAVLQGERPFPIGLFPIRVLRPDSNFISLARPAGRDQRLPNIRPGLFKGEVVLASSSPHRFGCSPCNLHTDHMRLARILGIGGNRDAGNL